MTHINESMMQEHYENLDSHQEEPSFKFAQESTRENVIDCFASLDAATRLYHVTFLHFYHFLIYDFILLFSYFC